MTVRQHAKAAVALIAIALNLIVCCVPLLVLLPLKFVVPSARPWFARRAAAVYRAAVAVAFVLAHPAKPVALVGTQRPERLSGLAGATGVQLDRKDVYDVIEASEGRCLP